MLKTLQQSLLILLAAALAGLLTAWLHPRAPAYAPTPKGELSPLARTLEQVRALPAPVLWIDARDERDFARGHIPGAVPLNEANWDEGFTTLILQWDPDQTLIVYCDATGCQTSEAVVIRLRRELGSDAIYYLEGGWEAWQANP